VSAVDPARATLARAARRGRVVVKIGSNVLCDPEGRIQHKQLKRLAAEIAELASPGRWPIVVSSGAIAAGVGVLGLGARPKTMPGLQAAAAIGQSKLVEAWSNAFARHQLTTAQVLLTHADLADRRRFLNARGALFALERHRAVPIINENDTVSFDEIAFGDNDRLAAQVSNLVHADLLILMSSVEGLLDADGARVPNATALATDGLVQHTKSSFGSGGMGSKLASARTATSRGAFVAIVGGWTPGRIAALVAGEDVGTILAPSRDAMNSREHWIAHTLRPAGRLVVDAGAEHAILEKKKSLLPSGIRAVEGQFADGEPVDIVSDGRIIARGLSRYSADQLREIAGGPSGAIAAKLGFSLGAEAVHRDDLVVFEAAGASPV